MGKVRSAVISQVKSDGERKDERSLNEIWVEITSVLSSWLVKLRARDPGCSCSVSRCWNRFRQFNGAGSQFSVEGFVVRGSEVREEEEEIETVVRMAGMMIV